MVGGFPLKKFWLNQSYAYAERTHLAKHLDAVLGDVSDLENPNMKSENFYDPWNTLLGTQIASPVTFGAGFPLLHSFQVDISNGV